jgi:hypothetical protein
MSWHHLCARFSKVKIRVLHPGIAFHHTVPILRGLPKGSRLSPTLFGIFAADLVNHLKEQFTEILTQSSTTHNTYGLADFYMTTYASSSPVPWNYKACSMSAKHGAKKRACKLTPRNQK